jgi:hypothetical protein
MQNIGRDFGRGGKFQEEKARRNEKANVTNVAFEAGGRERVCFFKKDVLLRADGLSA